MPEFSLSSTDLSTYVRVDLSDDTSPPKQTHLVPPLPTNVSHDDNIGIYAFAVPVSDIYSLLVRPPSLGWWFGSLVINTRAGESMPALFFHDSECESTILQKKQRAKERFDPFGDDGGLFWGGDEVLRWLRRYVKVERSTVDPSVYLIDPSEEDKIGFGQKMITNGAKDLQNGSKPDGPSKSKKQQQQQPKDASMDPLTKALKETRWKILEQLSKVTTFTRRTAQDIADNPKMPPQVRRLMRNPEVQTLQDEFDSARLYLARWAMGIAEQSEKEKNQRIWTANDVLELEESSVGDFEILDMELGKMGLQDRRKPVNLKEWQGYFDSKTGQLQVTVDEVKERIFHGGLDPDDGVRKEAWLFLLGFFSWDSTADERKVILNSKRDEFIRIKGAWWERMVDGSSTADENEWWKEQKGRIGRSITAFPIHSWQNELALTSPLSFGVSAVEKDVHRTDRHIPLFAGEDIPHPEPDSPFAEVGTNVHLEQMKDMLLTYNEYNRSLGYVQGMSDLLAPIYAVMQDDAIAFWGFVGFMNRMERNFLRDQSGMRSQLVALDQLVQLVDPKLYLHLQSADSTNFFFFFRMLLVWYKREFEWPDTLRLWEILWTDSLSSSFHLFIAVAILEKHRDVIMQHLKHFDEVLKYINELSGTMDLSSTLVGAEGVFRRFERTVEAVDKKDNFPAPKGSGSANPSQEPSTADPKGKAKASPSNRRRGRSPAPIGSAPGSMVEKVISSELRALLSRKVKVLDKREVEEHGGGTA